MFCLSKKRNQFIQNIRGNIPSVQQSNENRMKNKIKFIYQLLLIIQVCPSQDWYEGGVKYLTNISNIFQIYQIFQIFAKYLKYWPELFSISLASHHLHKLWVEKRAFVRIIWHLILNHHKTAYHQNQEFRSHLRRPPRWCCWCRPRSTCCPTHAGSPSGCLQIGRSVFSRFPVI